MNATTRLSVVSRAAVALWLPLCLGLAMGVSLPAFSQGAVPIAGVRVNATQGAAQIAGVRVSATQAAAVNLGELARVESGRKSAAVPSTGVAIPFNTYVEPEIAPTLRTPSPAAPDAFPPAPSVPSVAPSGGFMGLDDIEKVGTGFYNIPPDTMGVVGLSRVLVTLNNNYRVLEKANGATVSTTNIDTFWAGTGATGLFDPVTRYDPYNDRFIVAAVSDSRSANSSIVVGVSTGTDPNGTYSLFRYQICATVICDTGADWWADFPTVGFNKNWVVISVNLFGTADGAFKETRVLVVDYPSLLANTFSATLFTGVLDFTVQPCVTYSSTENTLYAPNNVSSAGASYRLSTITGTAGAPVYTRGALKAHTLAPLSGGWTAQGGSDNLPQASGTAGPGDVALINGGDSRILNCTFRNGAIWYAQTVGLPAGGTITRTGAQWVKLNTSGDDVDGGRVEDPTATATNGGKWYAFPTITVNKFDDVLFGFSQFASNQFPSAGYAHRSGGDPAGTMRDPFVYKAGEGMYWKTFDCADSTARNRWGDYSSTQVDPSDDTAMWTIQEYSKPEGSPFAATGCNSGVWSTWWAKVSFVAPTVTTPTSTAITTTSATLGGDVTDDGGTAITERGVVYAATATNADPLIGGTGVTKLTATGTTGVFTTGATGLTAGTGYSFKAYATNNAGTAYTSPASTFTTVAVTPTVTSPTSTAITTSGATLGGNVTSDGGAAITERGVVYALTTTNADPLIGGTGVTKLTAAGTTGVFTVGATGLWPGAGYSFKAYAINGVGTTYTSPVSTFSTLAAAPTVTTPTSTAITATSATLGGNVSDDGGSAITERGVVYAVTATNADPLIGGTGVTKLTAAGTTGVFTVDAIGLAAGTGYSFKAYATNSASTSYTTVATFSTLSTNANLANLVLTTATLAPAFASGTTSYTAGVPNATSSITVTPTVAQANATVTVNGVSVASGAASGAIALNVGANIVTTVVTAQDGVTTKTYTVTVTRAAPSTNANLSGLVLSSGTLSPAFTAGTLTYTASVGNGVVSLTVTPTIADATATVTVNGTAVASGSASGAIALVVGDNTVTTVVTAQDGSTTRTYTVTVTRAAAPGVVTPSPLTLDFGGQSMNTTAPAQTITLTNTGGSSLTVTSVTVSTYFAVSHDCSALAVSAFCTATITFTPTAAGALNGTLTVATSAGNFTANLAGTGEMSLVTHYYRSILRRAPDAGGKAFWEGEAVRMQAIGANVNETWYSMAGAFYTSAEYLAFARDDTGFVTDLYNTFFNRAPDAGGLSFWTGQLAAGMPREVALASFIFSTEFVNFTQAIFGVTSVRAEIDTVVDFYRGLLARLPDDGGFAFWVGRFRTAQCQGVNAAAAVTAQAEAISSLFALSPEYTARARNNAGYVGDLYNAFLRRGGDLPGVQFWINQIATGARSREQVRQQFVASPEFQARVAAIIAQGCLP